MILKKGFKGVSVFNLQQNLNLFGFNLKLDGEFGEKTEKAVVIFQIKCNIAPDGIVGPETQKAISLKISSLHNDEIPWYDWIKEKIGWNEFDNDKELSVYWKYTNVPNYKTTQGSDHAWCAMIICAALEETGFKSTNNAAAISYDKYGVELLRPKKGCILTIKRKGGSGRHVTLFDQLDKNGNFIGLGGNQSNEIDFATFKKEDIVSMRWPIKKNV